MKKIIRRLLIGLLLVLVLAGLAVALSLTPTVQTLLAQSMLAKQPGLRSSLESVSASFGRAEVANLRLQSGGAVLSIPSLQADLPVTDAVLHRRVRMRSLVAKGWTLDLSRGAVLDCGQVPAGADSTEEPERPAAEQAISAQRAKQIFGDILGCWALPGDISIDEVELDGDVLLPAGADLPPVCVHVVVKGGRLAAGSEGAFDVAADADLKGSALPLNAAALRGRLVAAFDAAGVLGRIGLKADVSAQGRATGNFPPLSVNFAAGHASDADTCTLAVERAARPLATIGARFPAATGRVEGTWKIDAESADLALLLGRRPMPVLAAVGSGTFATDTGFSRVQVAGDLKVAAGHLGIWLAPLERIGDVELDAGFALTRSGTSVQFDRLCVAISGVRPVATVRALQPFRFEAGTGAVQPADPRADWLDCSLQGLPSDWLAGWLSGCAFESGGLTGGFVVREADGAFALRSTDPLSAPGATIRRSGRTLGQNLDLSLAWQAEGGARGWQVRCAPLTVGSEGRRLGSWDGTVAQPAGAGGPIVVAGKWDADLEALAAGRAMGGIRMTGGRTATGEFSADFGNVTTFTGSLNVAGHDPSHTLVASLSGRLNPSGVGRFAGPIRFAFGTEVSELAVDGSLTGQPGTPVFVELTGGTVAYEQLRLLAEPLAAVRSFLLDGAAHATTVASPGPAAPFWGDWLGRVRFAFTHLTVGARAIDNADGILEIERDTVRLRSGHGDLSLHQPAQLEGTLAFDHTAAVPYRLNATASTDKLEASTLFPPPEPRAEPLVRGRFALAATFTGGGADWADLLAHLQEEYRLTSTTGIVRFLKTDLGGVNPEAPTPVSDAMVGTASAVGRLFSVKGDKIGSGQRSLSKNAQAVLNFSYNVAELGYSAASVTVIRGADRTWRLAEVAMTARDLHFTGTGRIGAAPDLPLAAQAIDVDLQLGLRGPLAAQLEGTGLLSTQQDGEGFTLLSAPVHFSGTMNKLDGSQWHDLLFNAARKPSTEKKDR